jgi:hypothetical protein
MIYTAQINVNYYLLLILDVLTHVEVVVFLKRFYLLWLSISTRKQTRVGSSFNRSDARHNHSICILNTYVNKKF